jgi:glycogen operon protein
MRDGYNLAVFSRDAAAMEVLLFASADSEVPALGLPLDPERNRTGDIWHIGLSGALDGLGYALRLHSAAADASTPTLIDPYAAAVGGVCGRTDRGVVVSHDFDWQDDAPPRRLWRDTVIYEAHVRGLTIHHSSGVAWPGTYAGLIEKIPYFRSLGVTALELMPVQAFDRPMAGRHNGVTGRPLTQYWGYDPVALFAPMAAYAHGTAPDAALVEFKTMVRELHRAGIEVILDVVFNHTAEGGVGGPTYSFRGLAERIYYMLDARGGYVDLTGCGNTLNCNHPIVRETIVNCLRHWVMHMHVDGFRFDLASVLGRDENGQILSRPPLLDEIAEDPLLREVKLIAEAWDSAGIFEVAEFPGTRWAEWNGLYRDDLRHFWRGDPGYAGRLATRLCGSADLFQRPAETPLKSINFVTCHDGFTLNDLVSYATKHNAANGEGNRDGAWDDIGDNNGIEGASADPAIEAVRLRQIKNMLATLFLSRGVPMLLGGDEFRRTQNGNDNAYCQDDETSWVDWRLAEANAELVDFVRTLVAFRSAHPVLRLDRFYDTSEIAWFGPGGGAPDWNGTDNALGCMLRTGADPLCLLFNATRRTLAFHIPVGEARAWRVAVATAAAGPAPGTLVDPEAVLVIERAMLVLEGRR